MTRHYTPSALAALCAAVQGSVGDTVRAAQDTLCRLYMGRIRERVRDKMREGSTGPREYPQSLGELCLLNTEEALIAKSAGKALPLRINGPCPRTIITITDEQRLALRVALYHRPRAPEPAAMPGLKETAALAEKIMGAGK